MSDYKEHTVVSTDGTKIAYVTFGNGHRQPLVVSHGGFTVADEWFATARALTVTRQVVIIERRGRGRSGDAARHNLDLEIDDLARVVTDLGGDVDLFGHSYGGALALGYALRSGFSGRMVLYEPTTAVAAPVGGERLRPVQDLLERGEPERSLSLLYTSVLRMPPGWVEAIRSSPTWAHHLKHLGTFLREVAALDGFAPTIEECAQLKAQVAFLLGAQADQWTRNNAAGFVQRLAGLTLLPVPGQSHFAHLTDPALLASRTEVALNMLGEHGN